MHRLHRRALAGAARAPQQRVVRRQAVGEAPGVLVEGLRLTTDALQKREIDPIYLGNRLPAVALRVPDNGIGAVQRDGRRGPVGGSLQSRGAPLDTRPEPFATRDTHL